MLSIGSRLAKVDFSCGTGQRSSCRVHAFACREEKHTATAGDFSDFRLLLLRFANPWVEQRGIAPLLSIVSC